MVQSIDVKDPLFISTALGMGYTSQDFQPITIEKIYQSSTKEIKEMNQMQRDYYIDKKYKALKQRQSKIISKVNNELQNPSRIQNRTGFNPVIKKLLQDHELRMQKKARYQQRVRVSKTRDAQVRKISNTIDFGRTSPNFSTSEKNSRVSKKSMRSQNSRTSSRSTSSHKQRLHFVRMKQQQAEKFKKNAFRYNQNQIKKKVEKVHQSRLSASRRLKTKSEISQQAVQERKEQLNSLRQDQIRDHIEKLKYKMLKNEYIKQRQQEKKLNQSLPNDAFYKKQLKSMFEQNEKEMNKMRYQSKLRSVERKKRQIQQQKRVEMQQKAREKKLKQLHVMKYREHMTIEEEQKKKQTVYYEFNNFEKARNKKMELQSEKKMKFLENKIKQEIVKSNFNSIENKRRLESQAKARKISEKLQQIKDIQTIKMKLTRERNRNSFKKVQDSDQKFSFY